MDPTKPELPPELRELFKKMEETLLRIKNTTDKQERAALLRLLRGLISQADQHSRLGD
jgi:hypothetical protein